MSTVRQPANTFLSGAPAPCTGIYCASEHGDCGARNVVVIAGQVFPACPRCQAAVIFALRYQAPHIAEDDDFRNG